MHPSFLGSGDSGLVRGHPRRLLAPVFPGRGLCHNQDMAFYLVRGRLKGDRRQDLKRRLESRELERLRPFGPSLHGGLAAARLDPETGDVVWEEEDYCSPPLAQEREAVLDHYFEDLRWEEVEEGQGWRQIEGFPSLWGA